MEQMKKDEIKRELLKGKPGKGNNFKYYKIMCKRCMVEYQIEEINVCTHCQKSDKLVKPDVSILELSNFN